jgi:membrane-associated phospholipid phosphatase
LSKRPYTSYNPYFIVPFLLWAITGAFLLLCLDKQTLFAAINTHYTPALDAVMVYVTDMGQGYTITIVLAILLFAVPSFRNAWYFVAALVCNVVPTLITQFVKHLVDSQRPLNYFHNAAWVHILPDWPRYMINSFPSGHTTGAFSFFCFLSFLLPEKYKKVALLFIFLAISVACSRLYLAAHFFADVYAGSMIGGVGCMFIFTVMKHYEYAFFKKRDTLG